MTSLEQVGEEVVGQARCPFESIQSNVGLFAGKLSVNQVKGSLQVYIKQCNKFVIKILYIIINHSEMQSM